MREKLTGGTVRADEEAEGHVMGTCGKCDDGWICEEHPERPWPHDDCGGPGMPCDVPTCPYRVDLRPVSTWWGLVCPSCRQPVVKSEGTIECIECGNRWPADEPSRKAQ